MTKTPCRDGDLLRLSCSSTTQVHSIGETSERLVSGVVLKYGKDSREYEMTGGVRKSDACGGLRLRIRKATITRLKSTADSKAAATQTA